jgi:hypothetical protein
MKSLGGDKRIMKSTFVQAQEPIKPEYPCFKRFSRYMDGESEVRPGDQYIVFFTSPGNGVVVQKNEDVVFYIGYTSNCWMESRFDKVHGVITLEF